MDLHTIGRLVAERRRAKKLTLPVLAATARIARSTLAALESGKLAELGFNKVLRVCAAVDLTIDVRAPTLDAPLMNHRHLTDIAGRELTKAAIDDITRAVISPHGGAWSGPFRAMRAAVWSAAFKRCFVR